MDKKIYTNKENKSQILEAVDEIANPIIKTLTPKGGNVVIRNNNGSIEITNDGYKTISSMAFKDTIKQAVLELIRPASIKTNDIAGDGTSTTVLYAKTNIHEGFKLIDDGKNAMDVCSNLDIISESLCNEIKKQKKEVKTDDDIFHIANTSSSNNKEIANNVLKAVKISGTDGMIFLETNNTPETEISGEVGFLIEEGMFSQHLANQKGKFTAMYQDIPVLITDKRLYYEDEVVSILEGAEKIGYTKLVIIAQDFIGQIPNMLLSSHLDPKVNMNILMVKAKDENTISDLSTYLNCKVVSEKRGSIKGKITNEDYGIAKKVYSDPKKTIISSKNEGAPVPLQLRIKAIREQIEKTSGQEKKDFEKRLACLTNGITTIKVGAHTTGELQEKISRYEDAINATRNAMREGYVIGGGICIYNAFKSLKMQNKGIPDGFERLLYSLSTASLKQIAENCDIHYKTLLEKAKEKVGYNAVTEKFEDLIKSGIIEPLNVPIMTIQNSISVAKTILSSNYMILEDVEEDKQTKTQ